MVKVSDPKVVTSPVQVIASLKICPTQRVSEYKILEVSSAAPLALPNAVMRCSGPVDEATPKDKLAPLAEATSAVVLPIEVKNINFGAKPKEADSVVAS